MEVQYSGTVSQRLSRLYEEGLALRSEFIKTCLTDTCSEAERAPVSDTKDITSRGTSFLEDASDSRIPVIQDEEGTEQEVGPSSDEGGTEQEVGPSSDEGGTEQEVGPSSAPDGASLAQDVDHETVVALTVERAEALVHQYMSLVRGLPESAPGPFKHLLAAGAFPMYEIMDVAW
jgi:hypothetical protein